MFHFPWFAPPTLCIQIGVPRLFTTVGFPIRTSPDQCLVGNSPKLFAATRVLHRLSAPRHPPHALSSLLTSISCLSTPSHRRLVGTQGQGPGPRSSRRTRLQITSYCLLEPLCPPKSKTDELSQQKLNSTLVCNCQRTLKGRPGLRTGTLPFQDSKWS